MLLCDLLFFFFKQKTAYEMRISDWSSDVCSSDLIGQKTIDLVLDVGGLGIDRGAEAIFLRLPDHALHLATEADELFLLVLGDLIAPIALARFPDMEIGRASCRERVCQYV